MGSCGDECLLLFVADFRWLYGVAHEKPAGEKEEQDSGGIDEKIEESCADQTAPESGLIRQENKFFISAFHTCDQKRRKIRVAVIPLDLEQRASDHF